MNDDGHMLNFRFALKPSFKLHSSPSPWIVRQGLDDVVPGGRVKTEILASWVTPDR